MATQSQKKWKIISIFIFCLISNVKLFGFVLYIPCTREISPDFSMVKTGPRSYAGELIVDYYLSCQDGFSKTETITQKVTTESNRNHPEDDPFYVGNRVSEFEYRDNTFIFTSSRNNIEISVPDPWVDDMFSEYVGENGGYILETDPLVATVPYVSPITYIKTSSEIINSVGYLGDINLGDNPLVNNSKNQTQVSYKLFSNSNDKPDKPLVVIEGFDLGNEVSIDVLVGEVNSSQMLFPLLQLGYDIIFINFDDPYHPVENISYAVTKALDEIWNQTQKVSNFKIIGLSIGGGVGIIANYIREVKATEFTFKTDVLLTIDTPHKGAYVPGSIQGVIDATKKHPLGPSLIDEFHKALSSKYGKQLLIGNIYDREQEVFNKYMDKYGKILNSYKQYKIAAFSCGSKIGKLNKEKFGEKIVDIKFDPFLGEANFKFWAQEEYPSLNDVLTEVDIDADIWLIAEDTHDTRIRREIIEFNLEHMPGGKLSFYQTFLDKEAPDEIYSIESELVHNFVPTLSSIGIDFNTPYFENGRKANITELEQTGISISSISPFDVVYFAGDENSRHAKIVEGSANDVLWELKHGRKISLIPPIIAPLLLN